MNKIGLWIVGVLIVIAIAVAGLYRFNLDTQNNGVACTMEAKLCPDGSAVGRSGPNCEFVACPEVKILLTEAQARVIAEKQCIKGGESLGTGIYNENTKTWWYDANLNATKAGCNPACVVSEETNSAEINWRCTGLLPQDGARGQITKLFEEKYPSFAETLYVNILQETENHARGQVSFVSGQPGGIFLATRINNEWKIVFDGNGAISCELEVYGFPPEMLKDCAQ